MGEVLNFAECKAALEVPVASKWDATEAEVAKYHSLLEQGYDEDTALEIIVMSRHVMGCSNGD